MDRIERAAREALGDSVALEQEWKPIDVVGWSGRPGARALVKNSWSIQLRPVTGRARPATVMVPRVSSRLRE